MSSRVLRLAATAVKSWTRFYTWRAPRAAADMRRAEIESDLWEQLNDQHRALRPLEIIFRIIAGIPDDLRWRVEHVTTRQLRRWLALAGTTAAIMAAVWIGTAARPLEPPPPPAAPDLRWRRTEPMPPPPPPPPPICSPPGVGRPPAAPCTPWP